MTLPEPRTSTSRRKPACETKKSRCFLDVVKIDMKKIDMKKLKKNMAVLEKNIAEKMAVLEKKIAEKMTEQAERKLAEKMTEQAEMKLATSKCVIETAANPLNGENTDEMECLEVLVNNLRMYSS
jgi:hypothetical protein